jgi:hypothetical protein
MIGHDWQAISSSIYGLIAHSWLRQIWSVTR